MRPFAALAPAPLRFSDAVIASPGRRPMQHLLPRVSPEDRRGRRRSRSGDGISGGRALHRKQTGRQGFHRGGTENTEKELMSVARWLNGRPRAAPTMPASPRPPRLRGGILACSLQRATPDGGCRDCRRMEASSRWSPAGLAAGRDAGDASQGPVPEAEWHDS
jgi:hypothetical protein